MGKLLTVPIMIFLMLCSCSGNKNINTDDEADIVLRLHDIWALTTIRSNSEVIHPEKRPVLELFPENKEILGFGGCNQYSGPILKVNKNEISFGPIISTKMACDELALESAYFSALNATQTYSLKALELTFYDGRGVPVLVFKKVD